jgi:hypothetical protein
MNEQFIIDFLPHRSTRTNTLVREVFKYSVRNIKIIKNNKDNSKKNEECINKNEPKKQNKNKENKEKSTKDSKEKNRKEKNKMNENFDKINKENLFEKKYKTRGKKQDWSFLLDIEYIFF